MGFKVGMSRSFHARTLFHIAFHDLNLWFRGSETFLLPIGLSHFQLGFNHVKRFKDLPLLSPSRVA
jgi:hypothetical protein